MARARRPLEVAAWSRRVACILLVAVAGCSSGVYPITVNIITASCQPSGPLEQVTHLRFLVSGPGMTTLDTVAVVGGHSTNVTGIPPGSSRVLEVRGYAGDPRDSAQPGRVISVGRSLPFDVGSAVPSAPPAPLRVVLRRVNVFVPITATGTCVPMLSPRAGHTATLLPDGRVLLAGGLSSLAGGGHALGTTEILDPLLGSFSPGPDLPSPRAYHSATSFGTGKVLLAGGEQPVAGKKGFSQVLGDAVVFDPATNNMLPLPLVAARSHHGAAAVADGGVLLVGGFDPDGGVVGTLEWFDPGTRQLQALNDALPRVGMSVVPSPDRSSVVVAGGSDGLQLIPDVDVFNFSGGTFNRSPLSAQLMQVRRASGLAPFIDAAHLVLSGGYADLMQSASSTPLGTSEIITLAGDSVQVSHGPAVVPRGDICSVALGGGQVLNVGGTTVGNTLFTSDGSAELLTVTPGNSTTALGAPPLTPPRYLHTCTQLADGSALITGGIDTTRNPTTILQDAYVFTAAPSN